LPSGEDWINKKIGTGSLSTSDFWSLLGLTQAFTPITIPKITTDVNIEQ
jgi:hypothetical protein